MTKKTRVLIIGAGLAGLAAANTLPSSQFETIILEAKNQAGGRATTDHSFGVPIDLGAFLIHGIENNPIAKICDQLGVEHRSFNAEPVNASGDKYFHSDYETCFIFDEKLKCLDEARYDLTTKKFFTIMEMASQLSHAAKKDFPFLEAIQTVINQGSYTQEEKNFFDWRIHLLYLYFGIELDEISARYWDAEEELRGGNNLLVGGYQRIIDFLAKNIQIKFNTPVTKINYSKNEIEVYSNDEIYTADAVIITVPISLLKHSLEFIPELPVTKRQAINHLQMGLLNKIIMKFPYRFWPDQYAKVSSLKHYLQFSIFTNYFPFVQQNILLTGVAGKYARKLESKSDAEITELMLNVLRDLFGDDIPLPEHTIITRWGSDPFSQGSYSYLPPGATPADYVILAEPVQNKLFFAGEATHAKYPATTHGAYLSGLRAAEEIKLSNHPH